MMTTVTKVAVAVAAAAVLASCSANDAPGAAGAADVPTSSTVGEVHSHDTDLAHDDESSAPGGGHHDESTTTYDQLPPETRGEVDQVIEIWARRYPTAADAMSGGWFRATRSLYGIGAHYVQSTGFSAASGFDPLNPNILLYDGEGPDALFAGVSYVVAGAAEGFVGDYDSWHGHSSVCQMGGSVVSLSEEGSDVWLSEAECTERGGRVLPLASDQMMHLWIGPDYIDSGPIFAHDHPKLLDGFNPKRDA